MRADADTTSTAAADSGPRPLFDPGWLFLIAGLGILGATVLIPAADDLDDARLLRDRALARESHRQERIQRYQGYLGALDERQPTLVYSLAASQLSLMPSDRALIAAPATDARTRSASVFPALEPPPLVLPEREHHASTLEKLATSSKSRLWLIAGGVVSVLVGLLPGARKR